MTQRYDLEGLLNRLRVVSYATTTKTERLVCVDPENDLVVLRDCDSTAHWFSFRRFRGSELQEIERRLLPNSDPILRNCVPIVAAARGRDYLAIMSDWRNNWCTVLVRDGLVRVFESWNTFQFPRAIYPRPRGTPERTKGIVWWVDGGTTQSGLDEEANVVLTALGGNEFPGRCLGWLNSESLLFYEFAGLTSVWVEPERRSVTYEPPDEKRLEAAAIASNDLVCVCLGAGLLKLLRWTPDLGKLAEIRSFDLSASPVAPRSGTFELDLFKLSATRLLIRVCDRDAGDDNLETGAILNLENGGVDEFETSSKWVELGIDVVADSVGWRRMESNHSEHISDERHQILRYDFGRKLSLAELAAFRFAHVVHDLLPDDGLRKVFALETGRITCTHLL